MAPIPTRRFGRTELEMPLLSLGGMRFQQSWSDLDADQISGASQQKLQTTLARAVEVGLHHIETARHYGSSERQLGALLAKVPDPKRILQTKVPPAADPGEFEAELETSFSRLGLADGGRIDLLAIHGINLEEHLQQTLAPGGCMEVVRRWQQQGRIGHVGFSTHGSLALIERAIASDQFDYVNLHWYFIRQENRPAIELARAHDMGVFVISPTDKGGHLHHPSARLLELCSPLHPIVFNDLFCLTAPGIHTISVGASGPGDLDLHLQAVELLPRAPELLPPLLERLEEARQVALGEPWLASWQEGLPDWPDTPGQLNLPLLLWLHNLLEAWDLESFAKARYGLLGNGGHWFPGANADAFDQQVSEAELLLVLGKSPWAQEIPAILRQLKRRLGGQSVRRLIEEV
ncbi:aldo/keto reductase [Cyanobium sp. HWJ4-Hawea]|uniref:aldo/keto reductase n=1 Tax=Cyanobium sp. HWJ4-Hawea TaxID=2823713 RepID=UPI0020CC18CC|nr:aldo/keto reductase [Cyanobium sp. HWJ4-Hawea]MCP9809965.1 aldo/keto reductase [Cyanobium sp. HWJ4-Hawea]